MQFNTFRRAATSVDKIVASLLAASILLAPVSPAFAAFGDGTPTIQNPDAFTADKTAPRVDSQSGAFSQRIPLDIPPGRNGLQPDLALQYNSQSTADGIVGYGWSLSIPYVQRLNKAGSQNLYNPQLTYFTSSLDGELANIGTSTTAATTSPSILDSLPFTLHQSSTLISSDSFSYTVPAGGTNKLMVALIAFGNGDKSASLSVTQNGVPLTCQFIAYGIRAYQHLCYLANPSNGTFAMSWSGAATLQYSVFTVKDAAQSNPIDATALNTLIVSGASLSTNITTTQGSDLLVDHVVGAANVTHTFGAGQTQTYMGASTDTLGKDSQSYKLAAGTAGTETMTRNFSGNDNNDDLLVVAIKKAAVGTALISGSYKARVDDGSSFAYALQNNTWTAYDKKGNRYLFGSDDTGRQYDTGSGTSTNTYKWYLQEIRDPNNNYVKFTYARDSNEMYPSQILYTGNTATDGIFKVTFATSTRPDIRTSYASTFGVTTNFRISEIDALINNTTVRKYLLGYRSGSNNKRSLLTSFQQQGYDENNTLTSLPAMTFTYASSSAQFFSPGGGGHTVNGQQWLIADTDGNGINDTNSFFHNDFSNLVQEQMVLNNTTLTDNTFTPPDYWASGPTSPLYGQERGVRYLDLNGDGKADVIRSYQDTVTGHPAGTQYIDLNSYSTSTGYGWTLATAGGTFPILAQANNSFILTGGIFGDFNGDGLPDYTQWVPSWISQATFLGNGAGWEATSTYFTAAQPFPSTQPTPTASQVIDINGDGLDDWVYSDGAQTYVLLNTGTGWQSTPTSQWTIATSTLYKDPNTITYYDRGIRFFDINGDGLPDFVRSYNLSATGCSDLSHGELGSYKAVLLNTGNGWATSTAYTLPAYIYSAVDSPCGTWTTTYNEYGNWNGNGQQNQDVLTTATNSRGGATSVTYTMSPSLGTNPELGYSLLVATALGIYDGRGNAATTTYTYSGGKQYASLGVRDRKFAGFAVSTSTAPDSVTGTYFSQGMSTSTFLGEQSDGYAQINRPFRKDVFDLAGNLVQRSFFRWDTGTNGNSTFVGLGRQVQQDYATDRTHRDSATDYLYASTTNDLTKKTEFGEVTGNDDGTFSDIGTDKRTTNITYAASSTAGFTVPIEKSVLDNSNASSSDQKLYYDNLVFGSVTAGNNTREEAWIATSTYASSTKSFNIYGLVASSTDRRGKLTSNIFDAYNLYVASSTNPLSQQTQFTYDYSVGKTKQTTDPNSRLSRTLYDGSGRVREIDQSDVTTPSTFATTTTFQYTDASSPPSTIHRADYLTATSTVDTYQYLDGLGRLLQERKASQYAGIFIATDRTYNQVGKLASLSLPYFSSGTSFTSASTNSLLFTNYTYDALQRPLTAVNAVGTTTNLYAKWTTTTTDANGNLKDYVRDAFGNLTNVVEHLGSSLATTTYSYDAANNLATTTDALGNVRAFSYDGLGRRLTAQDLHFTTDTTFGTSTYAYDDAGNATSQTDPKGQVTTRVYDALSRLVTESFGGQAQVTNTYDTCTKGIGYICTASSTSASSTSIYDALGRVATTTTTVFGIQYATANAYDLQGNITRLTYPNFTQINYTFNGAGLPMRVAQKAPGTNVFSDFVSNIDYGPHGQVVNMLFANGASTTKVFNANALYRLSSLQTVGASSTYLQNFLYSYDPVGNISQIANTGSTTAYDITNFSYDQLNRLTVASTTPISTASATTTIAIADSLPVTVHQSATVVTSDAFPYTVPAGGTNKLLVVMVSVGNGGPTNAPTATQNGASLTCSSIPGSTTRGYNYVCYLAAPISGTFSIIWPTATEFQYSIFTLQNAAQTSPIDASAVTDLTVSGASISTSVTTTQGNDLLLDHVVGAANVTHTFGGSQTQTYMGASTDPLGKDSQSYKKGAAAAGTETMTRNFSGNDNNDDLAVIAVKQLAASSSPAAPSSTPYRQSFTYDWLGNILSSTNGATSSAALMPSVLVTSADRTPGTGTSDSFSFDSGSTGSNRVLIYVFASPSAGEPTSATYNGQALTIRTFTQHQYYLSWGYLMNPPTGAHTFTINYPSQVRPLYRVMTLSDVNQTTPYDIDGNTSGTSGTGSATLTTTNPNDLLLSMTMAGNPAATFTEGSNQSELWQTNPYGVGDELWVAATKPQVAAGSATMSTTFTSTSWEQLLVALRGGLSTAPTGTTTAYAYAGTGFANPDAVTSIGNGLSSTTFSYDNNGNVTQSGNWSYLYDYLNRITTIGGGGSTSTFGYDTFGSRVFQAGTTSTTTYANKFYSIASTTLSGTSWATTTSYIWLGDTLLGTVDQQFKSGSATGTAKTRYVHPDHLGSTNVVTDEGGHLVETDDYFPFGASRISASTSTNEKRKYIGQFFDANSNLQYLNARYYSADRGQFVTQDPVFLTEPKQQDLRNPQNLNSYSYSIDNPITKSDPSGKCVICAGLEVAYSLTAQATFDSAFGRSSPAVYGGDVVGAALYGFAYPYAAAFPEPVAGVSAAIGNAAQQGFEYLSGDRSSFDPYQTRVAGTVAFGTQLTLGSLPIPIIGSSPLAKQISTKLQRGLISNVSDNTLTKIGISNAPGSMVGNFTTSFVQNQIGRFAPVQNYGFGLGTAMSMSSPSYSATISIAQSAIQLAQSAIAAYKK